MILQFHLRYILFLNNNRDKAITTLRTAFRFRQNDKNIVNKLVHFYETTNKPKEAITIMKKYLKINKNQDNEIKEKLVELTKRK